MENPIGKKRREKLEEINSKFVQLEENVNLFAEKIDKIESFITEFQEQWKVIFSFMTAEEEEPSQAEIDKAQKEQMEMFEIVIQNALLGIWNKPENQKAIQTFVSSLGGGGVGDDPLANIQNEDGSLNLQGAIQAWKQLKGGGVPMVPSKAGATSSGKSTGY